MLGTPISAAVTAGVINANNKTAEGINKHINKNSEALARTSNMMKGIQKDNFTKAAGLAATAGATAAVAKSKTAQNILSQSFEQIKNSKFGTNIAKQCKELADEAKPYAKKALDAFKNLPKPAKAVLGVGVALTGVASAIVRGVTHKKDEAIIREYGKKEGMIEAQYK